MTLISVIAVVISGLVFLALLTRNLFDRPNPLGTDAEQRERANP